MIEKKARIKGAYHLIRPFFAYAPMLFGRGTRNADDVYTSIERRCAGKGSYVWQKYFYNRSLCGIAGSWNSDYSDIPSWRTIVHYCVFIDRLRNRMHEAVRVKGETV